MVNQRGKEVCFIWFLIVVVFTAMTGTALAAGGPRAISVDAREPIGIIRSLQGMHWDPGPKGEALSENYRLIGIDTIRTHDAGGIEDETTPSAGVGDIDGIGPVAIFPDFSADPLDPESYNFGPTDQLIKNIRDTGAEVFFRVGRSNIGGLANNYVPSDIAKYGEIVKHVVMHYNKGWAAGFHYGIRYWEIWNEPDFRPFWDGTPEEFYELYRTIALAIRSVDRRAKIGGPASTSHNDYFGMEDSFLQFIVDNGLPMDFYSWHLYTNKSNNPYDFPRFGQHYRDLLDRFGFTRAQVICSEWNSALDGSPVIGGEAGQAVFVAESLIYSQDSPIDKSFYYSFIPVLPTPHLEHNAFAMVSSMNQTPIRLMSTGGDNQGFAVMAGRSFRRQELRVLVANYEISSSLMGPIPGGNDTEIIVPGLGSLGIMTSLDRLTYTYQNTNGYDLEINNIPIGWGDLTVEQYRVDQNHNYELVSSTTIPLEDRSQQSISVSGEWTPGGETIVQNPPPPMGDGASWVADPAPGVSQGIDLIVITGSNQCNGNGKCKNGHMH